jgi:HEAT repeat protein
MDLIRDRYQKVHPHVKSALAKIGSPAVVPLVRHLKDGHMHVRIIAAISLGQIADKKAVPGLIGALEDPNEIVSGWAAHGLGRIGDERAVAPLVARLSNDRARTRVAGALAGIGQPAVEPLSRALENEDRRVRRGAVQALGGIEGSAAYRGLISALADTDHLTQSEACRALEKRERSAVPQLIQGLKSKNRKIRDVAAVVLANIGDKRAVGPLIEAWKEDPGFAERVTGILRRLTGKTLGPKVEAWENWHRENR